MKVLNFEHQSETKNALKIVLRLMDNYFVDILNRGFPNQSSRLPVEQRLKEVKKRSKRGKIEVKQRSA